MQLKWLKWPNALLPCASLLVPEHSTCKERLSVDDPVRESDDETNAITRMPTKIRGDPQHFAKRDMSDHKNYEYIYIYIYYIYIQMCDELYINTNVVKFVYTRTWISPSLNLYGSQNIGHGVHAADIRRPQENISAVHHIRKKYVLQHGSLNVPIEHHPTIKYMVYNGYYKVMSNIPKMGQLPTPVHCASVGTNYRKHWLSARICKVWS